MINQFITEANTQEQIDVLYDQIVDMYIKEMKCFLRELSATPKSKRAFRHSRKPFWTGELGELWQQFHNAEKSYLKCNRKHPEFNRQKREFKTAQNNFDKALRKAKRSFQHKQVYELERVNTQDPEEFWKFTVELGPKKKNNIPMETINENGDLGTDPNQVLSHWKKAFQNLLTPDDNDLCDEQRQFPSDVKKENEDMEQLAYNLDDDNA